MTDFTAAEVAAAFDVLIDGEDDDLGFNGWEEMNVTIYNPDLDPSRTVNWSTNSYYTSVPLELELRGEKYVVTSVGGTGGMGQGSYIDTIFTIGTQTFRKQGYYASHYGTDWDGDLDEVQNVEKTITVWETVEPR